MRAARRLMWLTTAAVIVLIALVAAIGGGVYAIGLGMGYALGVAVVAGAVVLAREER